MPPTYLGIPRVRQFVLRVYSLDPNRLNYAITEGLHLRSKIKINNNK